MLEPRHAVLDLGTRRLAHHDGASSRSEALFYYFRLEDQIPETHLLRLIDKHISFEFVGEQLKSRLRRKTATREPVKVTVRRKRLR